MGERKLGNGWQKILHCFTEVFFFYFKLLFYGRIFDLHRNGIYAILLEDNINSMAAYGEFVESLPLLRDQKRSSRTAWVILRLSK